MTSALLAATGADSGVVATLAIIAAVLGGLGIALLIVRVMVRRRERAAMASGLGSDEHPVP